MTEVHSEMCGDEKFWIVTHTMADDGAIALPLFTDDGEKYVPDANDVFELNVRKTFKTTNDDPTLVFAGSVSVDAEGIPIWSISKTDSAINADRYAWTFQITRDADGKTTTTHKGYLDITGET